MATTVLVTGAHGFVGRNLGVFLKQLQNVRLFEVDMDSLPGVLENGLRETAVIFHLAGVNRPEKIEDYAIGNTGFTKEICERLNSLGRTPVIIFSSSIQAELDNPYGVSKRQAEEILLRFSEETGSRVKIFRMKNVFGKWCRPNYNSVVATFCHNIARGIPIHISDPEKEIELVYVDDVCAAMIHAAGLGPPPAIHRIGSTVSIYEDIVPSFQITLSSLADALRSFKDSRTSLRVPALDDPLIARLYATYLSYLEDSDFAYGLHVNTDHRGNLAEFLKSQSFGQIFLSRTRPGITRGNHYHHTKSEKFFVIQGTAVIRLRHIQESEIIECRVTGRDYRVVDIPPGYTHSIENIGEEELVTLFWADEIFDPEKPDTYYCEV